MFVETHRPLVAVVIVLCAIMVRARTVSSFATVVAYHQSLVAPQPAASSPRPSLQLPEKSQVLAVLRKVNTYQIAHPVVETSGSGESITDPLEHPWPRVTWYTGVMAAWRATQDPAFLEESLAYGRQLHWQVGKERLGPNRLFPIQLWAELYFVKHDPAMIQSAVKWLATPEPITPAGSREWYFDRRSGSVFPYADSLYGMPALALLAKATGKRKYVDIMNDFFDGVTTALFDRASGLYYRDPSFIGQRTPGGKKILWSRANGWVFAGIPRVLDALPAGDASRSRYLKVFLRMAPELKRRQGEDGLWRVNLDDAAQFPNPETSGSGFFCYGLAWGINHGILSRGKYLPAVQRAWAGLNRNISLEGKVLWGQGVDFEPNAVGRDSTHEYVTGAVMLAGSEVYKLTSR